MRHQAILNTHPSVVNISDDFGAFDAHGVQVPINEDIVNEEIVRLKAERDAKQYQYNRVAEYPPITDYLDGVVKGDQAQIQAYIDACLAVKAKYPKGA